MTKANATTIKGATVKGANKGNKGAAKGNKGAAPATLDAAPADTSAVTDAPAALSFVTLLVQALTARNLEQFSRDTETAIHGLVTGAKSINACMSMPAFAEIAPSLIKGARIATVSQDKGGFVAVKVLVKLVHCMSALINGKGALDPYSRTIAANLIALNGLSNKSALVSLSKSISYDALDQEQALKSHYNCSAGTACTQASSSRMMLKHLGICEVSKGKRGDVITLQDNDRARAFVALFAAKVA